MIMMKCYFNLEPLRMDIVMREYDGCMIEQRVSDRYMNATAMCKANGKFWGHYFENPSTRDFVDYLSTSIGIPIDDLVISRPGNPDHGGGTWVHPRIAINLAQWLSPRFAVLVSGWMDELLTTGSVNIFDHMASNPKLVIAQLQSALQLYDMEVERRQLAEQQRDRAIATKAEIGSRREATSMATASVAVRKVASLENKMGQGTTYKRVKAIRWLDDYFLLNPQSNSSVVYQQIGKQLSSISAFLEKPPILVPDSEFDTVKAYHVDVIQYFRDRLDADSDYMSKYR